MDILYIVPYVPSLIRARPYNLIRYLTYRGHHVTLLTLWTNDIERRNVEQLREYCHVVASPLPRWRSIYNCATALPTKTPLQAAYCWQPSLANQAIDAIKNGRETSGFDIIHVEHLRGANYGIFLKSWMSQNISRIPIVWDSVDCISYLFDQASLKSSSFITRIITRLDLPRTRRYEGWLVNQFDRIVITSDVDKEALIKLTTHNRDNYDYISLIPNGVDLEYFKNREKTPREPFTLVFSGKMSYHANISMLLFLVNKIMPHIWAKRSEVKLWIVGKDPPQAIQSLSNHDAITVTGTVDDIRPYLQKATVAVIPLTYGAGSQFKVLEAMASGTPVVATSKAVSALNVIPGKDLLVGNDPENFAKQVLVLLDNEQLRHQVGQNGRLYVERYHNWDDITERLEGVYQSAYSFAG